MEAKNLPDALKLIMEDRGWSQGDLARELGMSQAFVSQLINGRRDYSLGKVIGCLSRVGWEVRITPKAEETDPVERRSFLAIAASVAFVPAPKATPYRDPGYVRELASRLATSREQLGGTSLVPTAMRYVNSIQGAIVSKDRKLQEAASELSRISSLVLYDAGQPRTAEEIGTMALTFARRADYSPGIAQTYENLCMLTTASDPIRAASYAERGLNLPELTEEHRARLNARLGTALARDKRNIKTAQKLARTAGEMAQSADGLPVDTTALVVGSSGLSNASLRRYKAADAALTDAVRLFADRPLLSADWRARQIMATLHAGDIGRAADQMTELAGVVPLVTSARLDRHVREIVTVSAQWSRVPEMRVAISQLRSVASQGPSRTV